MEKILISAASAAKIIKADLASVFPNTSFSVTSDKKKGKILIKWWLGETDFKVKEATEQFIHDSIYLHGLVPVSHQGVNVTYMREFPQDMIDQAREKITAQLMADGRGLPDPAVVQEIIVDELRHTAFEDASKYL